MYLVAGYNFLNFSIHLFFSANVKFIISKLCHYWYCRGVNCYNFIFTFSSSLDISLIFPKKYFLKNTHFIDYLYVSLCSNPAISLFIFTVIFPAFTYNRFLDITFVPLSVYIAFRCRLEIFLSCLLDQLNFHHYLHKILNRSYKIGGLFFSCNFISIDCFLNSILRSITDIQKRRRESKSPSLMLRLLVLSITFW